MKQEERIVSSYQFDTGNVPSYVYDEIRILNENPIFNPDTKPYQFIDKIKSSTRNHGWHFQVGDDYYLALQHRIHGSTECISIYKTDKKQNFSGDMESIKSYISYVDIEYVVDKFVKEDLGIQLNN
jgi:hypothetical protein